MMAGNDNYCHCEARRAVAISRKAVPNRRMFDEWFVLVQFICYSASVVVPLYQEIATSAYSLLAMT